MNPAKKVALRPVIEQVEQLQSARLRGNKVAKLPAAGTAVHSAPGREELLALHVRLSCLPEEERSRRLRRLPRPVREVLKVFQGSVAQEITKCSTLSRGEVQTLHEATGSLSVNKRCRALKGLTKADRLAIEAFGREDLERRKREVVRAGGAEAYHTLMLQKSEESQPWLERETDRVIPKLLA
jgi:hypothetical protein